MPRSGLATAIGVCCTGIAAFAAVVAAQQAPPPPPPPVPPTPVILRERIADQIALTTPEQTGTGAILGTITSTATGQPVEGVRVTISGTNRSPQQIVSDDDGRFGFVNLPAGEFTLRAAKTGYVSVAYGQKEARTGWPGTPISLAEGQQIKNLAFSIPPGAVITGAVFDEKNRPSVATSVRVLRWSMQSGERVLTAAGAATTDDRGIYRVYGLAPGDYLVTVLPRNSGPAEMVYAMGDWAHFEGATYFSSVSIDKASGVEPIFFARQEVHTATQDPPSDGYAPVYYPGTPQLSTAATISLRATEERGGIDVRLMRVPMSRIEGSVLTAPGSPVTNIQARLINVADQVPGVSTMSARVGNDGRFRFSGVPPGQYRVFASGDQRETTRTTAAPGQPVRSTTTTTKLWASSDIAVSGGLAPDLVLSLMPGFSVSGRVNFEPGATPIPQDLRRVRMTLSPHGPLTTASGAGTLTATVEADGRFTFPNVIPGAYRLRAAGVTGWTMKSALGGGRDAVDFPLEIGQGADASNIFVTFSDRTSGLTGTVQDSTGRPTADHMVILFPVQEQYWIPQSRRIQAARPTTNGKFSFSGLPAGEYRLAALTEVEPGAWYDPSLLRQLLAASIQVSLADGQTRTQDLKVAR
jgi:hypothetical protein